MELSKGHMVIVKGIFVLGAAFVAPSAAVFAKGAQFHYWPETVDIVAALIGGFGASLAAGIGFFDNSFHDWQTTKELLKNLAVPDDTKEKSADPAHADKEP